MNKTEYINQAEENLFHVYNRFPVVFEKGQGVHLYDTDGKEYLDFASGIGVMALGYGNERYKEALKVQIDNITHTSNLYYHVPMIEAATKICQASGMDKVFFTNSGAEAIEGAIKTAKRYAYNRDGFAGHEVIAMGHSFHGRTVGSLSVTGNEHYREPFLPLMEGVKFAEFNNIDSVKAQITDKTCAILLETVQGEGGIYPADKEFLTEIREICTKSDILLILDEIQCGMGRTGSLYAYQQYGVKPDVLTTAKALGSGVPVGAFLVTDKVASNSLVPGDHGTTYGGNPLVCAAVNVTMDIMEEEQIIQHVAELTPYLEEKLEEISKKYDFIIGHRGLGFMQGIVLHESVKPGQVVAAALEHGLVILSAGADVIRLLPPLVIEKQDIDDMCKLLMEVLDEIK